MVHDLRCVLRKRARPIRSSFDSDPERQAAGKRHSFSEAANAFVARSHALPLVLIVEDTHWADSGTLELIDFLAKAAAELRIMIVLTHREPIAGDNADVPVAMADLARNGAHAVKLERLSREDVFELVSTAPRQTALRAHEIERIADLSNGNPLFAEQLLREALEGGPEGDAGGVTIPSTLHDLITDRLRLLEPDERAVLLLASAVGRRFRPSLLATASPLHADVTTAVLERACALQLLEVKTSEPLTYGFYHALVREAIYREIPAAAAPAIHASLARAWEVLGRNGRTYSDIAHHWAAAGDFAKADEYYTMAGDAAMGLYAYTDAQRFYERALRYAHGGSLRRAILLARIAEAQYTIGALEEALVSLQEAFDIQRSEGSEAEAIRMLERIVIVQSRNYDTMSGVRVAESALDGLTTSVLPEARFGLLVTTAGLALSVGDAINAEVLLERASTARSAADPTLASAFHDVRARLNASRGRYGEAMSDFETSVRLARTVDGGDALIRVLTNAADVRALLGAFGDAVDLWTESYALARERHLGWRIPFCALGCASVLLTMGEVSRALEYVESAMRYDFDCRAVRVRAVEVGIPLGMLTGRDDIVERCDDPEIVERVFRSRDAFRVASLAAGYIPLLFQRERAGDARELLARATDVLRTGDESPALYVLLARHGSPGIVARARAALDGAALRSRDHVAHAFLPLFDAITKRRQRRVRASKERAALAAGRFEKLGLRYWQAIALEVAEQERRAIALLRGMGAVREALRIERSLASDRGSHLSRLTPREEQIAVLVREGMTNRQISTAFGISQHTVESHLKSIFNRLGIRSRWQISATAAGLQTE